MSVGCITNKGLDHALGSWGAPSWVDETVVGQLPTIDGDGMVVDGMVGRVRNRWALAHAWKDVVEIADEASVGQRDATTIRRAQIACLRFFAALSEWRIRRGRCSGLESVETLAHAVRRWGDGESVDMVGAVEVYGAT